MVRTAPSVALKLRFPAKYFSLNLLSEIPARAIRTPLREYALYVMMYHSSRRVTRGSSTPNSSYAANGPARSGTRKGCASAVNRNPSRLRARPTIDLPVRRIRINDRRNSAAVKGEFYFWPLIVKRSVTAPGPLRLYLVDSNAEFCNEPCIEITSFITTNKGRSANERGIATNYSRLSKLGLLYFGQAIKVPYRSGLDG
jgi:hypothetical protein